MIWLDFNKGTLVAVNFTEEVIFFLPALTEKETVLLPMQLKIWINALANLVA